MGSKDIQNLRTFAVDAASLSKGGKKVAVTPHLNAAPRIEKQQLTDVLTEEIQEATEDARTRSDEDMRLKPPTLSPEPAPVEESLHEEPVRYIPEKPIVAETHFPDVSHDHLGIKNEVQQVAAAVEKESILAEHDEVLEVNPRKSGTIIRDTKRKRFRLIPAMITATTAWFTKQKDAYDRFMHPHHAVAKAEARKEVIEEAVRSGTLAPKEDFATVAERMKDKKRIESPTSLTFKEKQEVPEPQWTYVEDSEDGKEDAAPILEEEPVLIHEPEPQAPEPSSLHLETQQIPSKTEEAVEEAAQSIHIAEPATTESSSPAPVQEVAQEETPHAHTENEVVNAPRYAYVSPAPAVPQRPRTVLVIILMCIAILSGVAASYYLFNRSETQTQQIAVSYTIPALFHAQSQVPLSLGNDRQALLEALTTAVNQAIAVTQIYPTLSFEGQERPAPAADILTVLSVQAPGSFTRSIREISFGATSAQEPFIVMNVSGFDTAFAGMLEWEKTLSSDLSPLFGTPVVESFDPSARTDTQVREAFFKDTIASNKNIRLLLDEKGDDRIVYTFINQNTLLITTTRTALENILPLIK